jgi:beta-lactamase regulating signal transducer with metallopeptidase domain
MSPPFVIDLALRGLLVAGAALLGLLALRRHGAGLRHVLCGCGLAGLLALPAACHLLPRWQVALPGWSASGQNAPGDGFANAGVMLGWCTFVWAVGIVVVAGRIAMGVRRLRRHLLAAEEAGCGRLTASVAAICQDWKLPQAPRVLLAAPGVMPVSIGWGRGIILLPEEAETWPEDRLRMVLLHELGHLRRRDSLVQWLGLGACVLHWFNPLSWLLLRILRREREFACDALVVDSGVSPVGYARHLLDFATASAHANPPGALAPALPLAGADLRQRIRRLLQSSAKAARISPIWCAAGVLAGSALIVLASVVQPAPQTDHLPSPSAETGWTDEEIHQRWAANPFPGES